MSGYGQRVLLDWSAYTRFLLAATRGTGNGRLTDPDLRRFENAAAADELLVSHPFRIEVLYSAQSASEFARRAQQLDAFSHVPADAGVLDAAVAAQQRLAETPGISHRVKFADLLVAAIADRVGAGVLHYDADYDIIGAHSGLKFTSVWIADRGSID